MMSLPTSMRSFINSRKTKESQNKHIWGHDYMARIVPTVLLNINLVGVETLLDGLNLCETDSDPLYGIKSTPGASSDDSHSNQN